MAKYPNVQVFAMTIQFPTIRRMRSPDAYRKWVEEPVLRILKQRKEEHCLALFPEYTSWFTPFCSERAERARRETSYPESAISLAGEFAPATAWAARQFGTESLTLGFSHVAWTTFHRTFQLLARKHKLYIAAGGAFPSLRQSSDEQLIQLFGDEKARGEGMVFVPTNADLQNRFFLFSPEGKIVYQTSKSWLTKGEEAAGVQPGNSTTVPYQAPFGPLGITICLDGFNTSLKQQLATAGTRLILKPSANNQPWAGLAASGRWQPEEWGDSILNMPEGIRYIACSGFKGNIAEGLCFDLQPTITSAGDEGTAPLPIGMNSYERTGSFLATGDWSFKERNGSLERRRQRLQAQANTLLPGGSRANQYGESIIQATLNLSD